MFQERQYQTEAKNAIMREWEDKQRTLLVLPTGCGKTIVFCSLIEDLVRHGKRVLILAHRGELLDQAADKLSRMTGLGCSVEKADRSCLDEWFRVVVGSVQSLMRPQRLAQFPRDYFDAIIVDEAHHVISDSYMRVLDHFNTAKVLGVTATPDRGDMRNLGSVFESLAYEYTLPRAIRDGYLCPIKALTIPLKIDLTGVATQNGDFQAASLGSALDPYLEQIAEHMREHCAERKTVAFLPLIATSRKFRDILESKGFRAAEVNGESSDRANVLADWEAGKYDVLCNSMLLTEGWDSPHTDCIVPLRATKIRSLFCLDTKTEVLTEHGWRSDVSPGVKVAAFDINSGQIEYRYAIASIRRPLLQDERFISIKGQSVDIRVTNKHRMIYDTKRNTGWKFINADNLSRLRDTNYIPVAGIVKAKGVPLTDDELRFIGWVMTDGTINRKTNGIAITQGAHQPWCDDIDLCLTRCGFKFTKTIRKRKSQFKSTSDCVMWTISKGSPRGTNKHLRGWGALEQWLSKDLSPSLFECSTSQFDVLLHAIHLGDGAKQSKTKGWTRRSYHIATGNKVFAERLQILAIQRGWRCNLSFHSTQNKIWILHLKKQHWSRVGGHVGDRPSWITENYFPEECWCVENDMGTLITRRNGKVAIVGNCQMVGRGTRLYPGKDELLLLDFLWNTTKLDLVRPAHLIAGSEEVAQKMTEQINEAGGPVDLEQAELFAESSVVEDRERALAEKLKEQRNKKTKLVDPLQYEMSICAQDLADYVPAFGWEMAPPSDKQIVALEKLGICANDIDNAGKASLLLNKLNKRRDDGLSTPKQIRFLESRGFQHVGQWQFDSAKSLIDRIAGNAWKVPPAINPSTYAPQKRSA